MRAQAELHKAAAAQVPAADYIPYGTPVRPNVIKLRDTGDYMAVWRLEGISFETADAALIKIRKEGLNNFTRALGGGQFAIWSHRTRREVRERLDGKYSDAFCQAFNDQYYETFKSHRQMATELYLTLIYRPTPSKIGRLFKQATVRSIEDILAREAADIDVLDDAGKQVEASLRKYEPERLGTFTRGGIVFSEMASFLGFLLNGYWEDIPLQHASLGEYLPTSRLHFGDKNGMLEIWHPRGRKYVGFLDFKEYPAFSEPGMNDGILYGDYEYIETQSFTILNKRDAEDALDRQQGQMISSGNASKTEIKEMELAKEALKQGQIEMGEYHYTLAIFGSSLSKVSEYMADARGVLQDGPGFTMAVIDAIPECAWFAQLPGNWRMRPREANITSRNFCCLSPFHNFARGKRNGNPWGEALALFKTPSGQPFYFNFHVSPDDQDSKDEKYPGNTFICGTTGAGKTALEMALMSFARKYLGLRCVAFDKDRGMEIGIRRMGGKYFALARGEPTGFNPFQQEPTERNIDFCEKLVRILVAQPDNPLSAKEEADISHAVRTVMSKHVRFEVRCLSAVAQALPMDTGNRNSLQIRLKKWLRGQPLGWAFDNPRDTQDFSTNDLFGYDYTEFLDDPEVCTPIMAYLLHITESLIDGRPFIYFMAEFWKPLQNAYFTEFAKNKQKTIRKQNGLGVFDTQSPSDVLEHDIGKTMVEQSVTKIFLPNPSADHDDYVKGFKVTEAEFRIIQALGENSRMFLVKQGHRSAIVQFDLSGMTEVLNIISGTLDNVELLDGIRAEVGDDPEVWAPIFHDRVAQRRALKATK